MIIFKNDYFQIQHEPRNSLFITYWLKSPENTNVFKKMMLSFLEIAKKTPVKNHIWLQQNFFLELDLETHLWAEKNINEPAKNIGAKNIAFVVGKDLAAHLNITNYFNDNDSVFRPWHFASEDDARNWIINTPKPSSTPKETIKTEPKILFVGVDEQGNPIFKFNTNSKDITKTIKFLNSYLERDKIFELFADKFNTLSERENDIISRFCNGKKLTEIAEDIHISIHTIRTHWKNIKRKVTITDNNKIIEVYKILNQ